MEPFYLEMFNRHNRIELASTLLLTTTSTNLDIMSVKKHSNKKGQESSFRGITYRLCPGTQEKANLLSGLCGACRFVWNVILGQVNEEYSQSKETGSDKPNVSRFSLITRYPSLRKEIGWLSKYSSAIVRFTLFNQSDAWIAFFKGKRKHPTFHNRFQHNSFTAPKGAFKIVDNSVYIQKVGWMKFRRKGGNPYPDGEPIELTVKKDGRYWKMSVLYKIPTLKTTENGVAIGIDLNTCNVAWTSTEGERGMLDIKKPHLKEIKIRRYQRKLARQQKGSGRYKDTQRKISKLKRQQRNARKNQDHQNSRALANRAQVLIREDLKIENMSKSAKGTIENPGTNVRQKSGLNRVILNASWGRFNKYCDYKIGMIILVDPKYTSQRCSKCGYTSKENRKTQSKFKCMTCGYTDHADYNSSANILASGIGAAARGGAFPLGTPMIREMDTFGLFV